MGRIAPDPFQWQEILNKEDKLLECWSDPDWVAATHRGVDPHMRQLERWAGRPFVAGKRPNGLPPSTPAASSAVEEERRSLRASRSVPGTSANRLKTGHSSDARGSLAPHDRRSSGRSTSAAGMASRRSQASSLGSDLMELEPAHQWLTRANVRRAEAAAPVGKLAPDPCTAPFACNLGFEGLGSSEYRGRFAPIETRRRQPIGPASAAPLAGNSSRLPASATLPGAGQGLGAAPYIDLISKDGKVSTVVRPQGSGPLVAGALAKTASFRVTSRMQHY